MVLIWSNCWDRFICYTLYKHFKYVKCISKHRIGKAICNTNTVESTVPSSVFKS